MKEIIPKDDYGVFVDGHDVALVDSRYVAQYFEKRHDAVLRDIRELDCSEEFSLHNFVESTYKDDRGKKQPCYYMTRDGFVFLAMLIVEFYNQKTGFFICPWCEMKNRKKEKECEANGETCRSERPCESGNAVHNG